MSRARLRSPSYDVAAGVEHLRHSHPRMAALVDQVGPCTISVHALPPFEALLESIVYQQLNGRAAETILARVLAIYRPKRFPAPPDLLATPDETLRAAGLSRAKTAAVKSLAQHSLEGTIPSRAQALRMDNDELIERLTRVRGVGRWTVEMFLIFGLSRPDVWPVLDFGVRKGLGRAFRKRVLPTPKQALPYGRRFSPYGSLAAWYFWRAAGILGESPPPLKKKKAA
ncbi:MAG: DNA-3-methyladenine glycosylase 2 family protein [Vicinamibacteria bacterium]